MTRGAQLILPAAVPLSVDPFSAMTLGVASALLPSLLAAKAAEVANAAAAKVLVGEQQKMKEKNKKKTKVSEMCPLSPEDRDLLRTVTGAALGAGASSLAGRATPLELGRCALTLKSTKPAAFQWVVLSGGRVNLCTILLGKSRRLFSLFLLSERERESEKKDGRRNEKTQAPRTLS